MRILSLLKSFRKQFQKNEYNYKNNNTMPNTKTKLKQFQWKKGDKFGDIETVESEDSKFYYFKGGSKLFKNVQGEFLEPVLDGVVPFPKTDVNDTKPNTKTIETKPVEKVVEVSAIEELVEKLSKKNIEKFETTLNLNIPNKDIYNMLVNSADEDPQELINVIAKVAVSKIEINKLQEYLTIEVTNFINKYYNE